MRKIMFLTVLLCLVVFVMPAYADKKPKDVNVVSPLPLPVTGTVNVNTVYRFVGLTQDLTNGIGPGPIGMNRKCRDEFAMARMCTSKEFFDTGIVTNLPTTELAAWIAPSITTETINIRSNGDIVLNATTATGSRLFKTLRDPIDAATASVDCVGWTSTVPAGAVVTQVGNILISDCTSQLPVACCAPGEPAP